jgi:aspartate-semialdehyde dehydrogenase
VAVGLALLGISGKTPFAYIGQRGLALFDDHPTFEIRALIADDPADVGKPLGEAVQGRWLLDEPLPERWAGEILQPLDAGKLRDRGVELVLSGLPGPHARELDPVLAAGGLPVVSESAGLRLEPDVPLVVTEVNADHLALTRVQKTSRGYGDGYLVASPVCTAVIAAIAAKPLIDRYGLKGSVYTTLQALSGAGPTGVPGMYVVDNVLPFIQDEEEKLRNELAKILGTLEHDAITPHPAPLSATCTRVPVRDGHTISASLSFEQPVDVDEAAELLAAFRGPAQRHALHSAPATPIVVRTEANRPQPVLDRDAGDGRIVSVGRIRAAEAMDNGLSYVAVGHNHDRGTVGNAVPLCELLVAEGYVGDGR